MPADDPARPAAALVLLAAGAATRFRRRTNKVFQSIAGRSVLTWSLDSTASLPAVTRTLLVVRDDERTLARATLDRESPGREVELVTGGATRHESEFNVLRVLAPAIAAGAIDIVVIHDAARPLAASDLFNDVIHAAHEVGGAVPGRRVHGVIPVPGTDVADGTKVCVQTPQAFRAVDLLRSYQIAATHGFSGSDTASCVERFSDLDVRWLPGPATNIKITFAEDLRIADRIIERARATEAAVSAGRGPGQSPTANARGSAGGARTPRPGGRAPRAR